MAKRQLQKGDRNRRRQKIIDASRSRDAGLLPQLLARLDAETYENRRHIVRALGKIGGPAAGARLLQLLSSEQGLILGDIAHSLGKLGVRAARAPLRALRNHELEWVRLNVDFALGQLGSKA